MTDQKSNGLNHPDPPEDLYECFGLQMGWMMEDGVADPVLTKKCYTCPFFERCNRISMVRTMQQLRFEIRSSTRGLRESLGGAHSSSPFW